MTYRRSRASAVALLTVILALVFCAAAWAQDGDPGEVIVGGDAEAGGESGGDNCAIRSVGDDHFELDDTCEESSGGDETSGGSNASDDFEDDGATPSGSVETGYGPVAAESEAGAPFPIGLIGAGLGVFMLVGFGLARLWRAG